jgi:hypothetical protein
MIVIGPPAQRLIYWMLRSEPSKTPAIELPINVVTECKNSHLRHALETSAVEIASRRLYLNGNSRTQ